MPVFATFERRILEHRDQTELIRQLGCTILVQPWPRDRWILIPSDWKKNIVTGKGYAVDSPAGAALWPEVRSRLDGSTLPEVAAVAEEQARYVRQVTIRPRLGQGAFRVEVTDAYSRRCAITGESSCAQLCFGGLGGLRRNCRGTGLQKTDHWFDPSPGSHFQQGDAK